MNTSLIFRKSEHRLAILLALSGILLRGLYLLEYSNFVNFDLAIGADVGEYQTRAEEILRGIIFPPAPEIHAPLYSFFLAGLQKIGFSVPGVRIIQTLLNFFSWLLLYFLLLKRSVPAKYALVFLGFSMVLAPLIFHPAELISESLLLPLFTAVFFCLHQAENKKAIPAAFCNSGAGIFSALALLTHGMMSGFLVLQTCFLLYQKKWAAASFFLLGVLIVLLPFLSVKSCHYGTFTGLQANTGFNIYLGNNTQANGKCYMRPGNLWRKTHVQAEQTARARHISTNRYFLEKVCKFWKETPWEGIKLYLQKVLLIFSGKEYIAGADGGFLFCRTDTINLLRFLTFPVFLLAFYGIWQLVKKKELLWWPPLILGFSLFLMQILTVTSGRYRLLMFPALIYLAAVGALHINWKKWILPALAVFFIQLWLTYSFMGSDKAEGTALLGQAHYLKGNFEHAKDLLLFSNKHFKDTSRINNMLGNIAEKEGNLPLARQYYQKVTREEKFMPEGWMNLANITPDPAKAEALFRKAMEAAFPSPSADLLYNYANFFYMTGRYNEAEKTLFYKGRPDTNHAMTMNLCGLLAANKKEFKKAAGFFHRAALLKPDETGFWKNTAIMARLSGNRELESLAAQKYLQSTRRSTP